MKKYFCIDCKSEISRLGLRCRKCNGPYHSKAISGENHQFFGKKRPEHSERMSGKNHPLYGKKHKKSSILLMQCKRPSIQGKNHPLFKIGHTKETRQKLSLVRIGKSLTEMGHDKKTCKCSFCRAYRGELSGKNNPLYIHGNSIEQYPKIFNVLLKESIRSRDNYICQNCNTTNESHVSKYKCCLGVHHIDYNKQNCAETNLITLCNICNIKANTNIDYWYALYTYKIEEKYESNQQIFST